MNITSGYGFTGCFISLFLLFCMAVPVSAQYKRDKVAVLDFQTTGVMSSNLGKVVAERVTSDLVKSGRFEIVEQSLIKKIMEEQKLPLPGLRDTSSAAVLGRILGVRTVVVGSLIRTGDNIEISLRLINAENSSIIADEIATIPNNADVNGTVVKLSNKILNSFPLHGYVVQREADKVIIDSGSIAGIKNGTRFIVYKEGKALKHPKTGEVLDIEEIGLGEIEIREVREKTSHGVILKENRANSIKAGDQVKNSGFALRVNVPPASKNN